MGEGSKLLLAPTLLEESQLSIRMRTIHPNQMMLSVLFQNKQLDQNFIHLGSRSPRKEKSAVMVLNLVGCWKLHLAQTI